MRRNMLAIGLVCVCSVTASAVTFSDSSFANSFWTGLKVAEGSTPSTTFTATYAPSFGERNDLRLVTHFFGPADPVRSDILTFHGLNAALVDPSVTGAVLSVSFSFDLLSEFGGTSGGVAYSVAVLQGGTVFTAPAESGVVITNTGWEEVSTTELTASDFASYGAASPDFSATGAPILFGLVLSNGSNLGIGTSSWTYLDDFSTTVTQAAPVPEPAHATMLVGLAALVAAARRRRAARAL